MRCRGLYSAKPFQLCSASQPEEVLMLMMLMLRLMMIILILMIMVLMMIKMTIAKQGQDYSSKGR